MSDFMVMAFIGGVGVSIIAGTLGVFIVWRKLSFFGDTVAHASLGGVGLSLLLGIPSFWGPFISGLGIALLLSGFKKRVKVSTDTWLAIVSQVALALGILFLSFFRDRGIQIQEFLFGDILALSRDNLLVLYSSVFLILGIVMVFWKKFLLITISEELAALQKIKVSLYETLFLCLLALGVALCIKFFGILLLTALMIIPASIARQHTSSPLMMLGLSIFWGICSVSVGLGLSYVYDIPTSPAIVVSSASILLGTLGLKAIFVQRA
jgi:zinc transport system permease protein